MKNTKRALGISVLALLLCLSMFVGTTFAWFTDSVTVAGNKIQAGTLDIELWKTEYNDYMDQPGEEGFVEENITNDAAPIFNSDLWEPGYLAYTNLTVKNVGTLAAKIKANLVATSEVGKLAEVIDVYVAYMPLADYYDGKTIRQLFNREIFWGPESWGMNMFDMNVKHVGTLKDVMEQGIDLALFNNESAWIEAGDEYQINIALKMREEAGNEYQGKTAGTFDIRILAAQATYESDSFDNQYDKDAEWPVNTQADLDAALANAQAGETIALSAGVVYELSNIPAGVNIDGNGATVAVPNDGTWSRLYSDGTTIHNAVIAGKNIVTSGSISFVDCTFEGNLDNAVPSDLVSFTDCTFNAAVHFASGDGAEVPTSNFVATNCVFNANVTLADFGSVLFTGCEFYGSNWAGTNVIIYSVATFDSCTFSLENGIRLALHLSAADITLINCSTGITGGK